MKRLLPIYLVAFPMCLVVGCYRDNGGTDIDNTNYDAGWVNDCEPWEDDDDDFIANGDEGCMYNRDSDGDQIPDYIDRDSDGDGIPDSMEAGDEEINTPPRDSDGDSIPDYVDDDSDNDGVFDGDEDRNGDGLVGECKVVCDPNGGSAECGPGQFCLATGKCDPPVTFECSLGETDPLNPDTDGDGIPDSQEGSFICNQQSEDNPFGRKPVQYKTGDNFQIGLPVHALYFTQEIVNSAEESEICEGTDDTKDDDNDGLIGCEDEDCVNTSSCGGEAAVFDLPLAQDSAAGFILVREAASTTVEGEGQEIATELTTTFGADKVFMRASGSSRFSHDNMPTVVSAIIDFSDLDAQNIVELRNKVLATLMGRSEDDFSTLPTGEDYTDAQGDPLVIPTDSRFILSFAVQYRGEEPGEPGEIIGGLSVVVMGAVARLADYNDYSLSTIHHVSDMSNGTALAAPSDTHTQECEPYAIASVPMADVIWVIDESGSMWEEQQSVASNAVNFFNRAQAYGLDFRMGVVDVNEDNNGVLCTGAGVSGDYFLGPADLTAFQACALEPWGGGQEEGGAEYGLTQGYNAIISHLPRGNGPGQIRPDAQLVIIYVSDERPDEVEDAGCCDDFGDCMPNPEPCIQPIIQPTLDLLMGISDPEGMGTAHAIIPPPPNGCPTADEVDRGYSDIVNALGGQIGSVCQADLGATMQIIIEDIVANSSPVVLRHVPISVSIACSKEGVALERSRQEGFDYRGSANTVVFIGQDFDPLHPSEILVSYERWVTSIVPE